MLGELQKNGSEKFGGKPSEYISEALKIAWNSFKKYITKTKQLNTKKVYACVVSGYKVTVESDSNSVFGNTYPIKDFLKKNYDVKWNPIENCWVFKNNNDLNAFIKNHQIYSYI